MAQKYCRKFQSYEQGARTLQTTDGRTMTYSEHELEFTFAKNTVLGRPTLSLRGSCCCHFCTGLYLPDLVYPLFFCKFNHIFSFGCHPLKECHPGGPSLPLRLLLVTPSTPWDTGARACCLHTLISSWTFTPSPELSLFSNRGRVIYTQSFENLYFIQELSALTAVIVLLTCIAKFWIKGEVQSILADPFHWIWKSLGSNKKQKSLNKKFRYSEEHSASVVLSWCYDISRERIC